MFDLILALEKKLQESWEDKKITQNEYVDLNEAFTKTKDQDVSTENLEQKFIVLHQRIVEKDAALDKLVKEIYKTLGKLRVVVNQTKISDGAGVINRTAQLNVPRDVAAAAAEKAAAAFGYYPGEYAFGYHPGYEFGGYSDDDSGYSSGDSGYSSGY